MGELKHFYTNFTVGRQLGEKPFKIDVWGSYIFITDNNTYSAAAFFTAGDINVYNYKLVSTASIGAGLQKIESRSKTDAIIPCRFDLGYRFTDKLTSGIESVVSLNLSGHAKWTPNYLGVFIGIRI
jgi:hypothetical protein